MCTQHGGGWARTHARARVRDGETGYNIYAYIRIHIHVIQIQVQRSANLTASYTRDVNIVIHNICEDIQTCIYNIIYI